MTELWLFQ
jgi:CRP-like cAMP-binding protein